MAPDETIVDEAAVNASTENTANAVEPTPEVETTPTEQPTDLPVMEPVQADPELRDEEHSTGEEPVVGEAEVETQPEPAE